MLTSKHTVGIALDKKEANAEIKRQIEASKKLVKKDCFGEKNRARFLLNQLNGHSRLTSH